MRRLNSIYFLMAALAATLLGGCSQDDGPVDNGGEAVVVNFNSGIQTRTAGSGDTWVKDDPVGIFMLTVNGNLPENIIPGADNMQYNVSDAAAGTLSPAGAKIYYPRSGKVDFIAYYPYGTTGTGAGQITTDYKYNISVTGQKDEAAQNATDVLYSNNAANLTKGGTPVNLQFRHVMSKVTLNVTLGTGMTSFSGNDITRAVFSGMPQTATLALAGGSLTAGPTGNITALKASAATKSFDATFTAILVPRVAKKYSGRTMVFSIDGRQFTGQIPDSDDFEAGSHYSYPVTINETGVTVGTPSITQWNSNEHQGNGTTTKFPIETVFIKAGTFLMGSPDSEADRYSNETQHEVTLTQDFYMAKYETTNAQYVEFLNAVGIGEDGMGNMTSGYNGIRIISYYSNGVSWSNTNGLWEPSSGKDKCPVTSVPREGGMAYAKWIGGSLPTEAQWEYACRAGTTTAYSFGDDAADLGDYAWYKDNSGDKTHPVGTKKPNPWGLYDMHGNVVEWCLDSWNGEEYDSGAAIDPISPNPGKYVTCRGSSSFRDTKKCRSAFRSYTYVGSWNDSTGFRVIFVP